MNILKLFFLFNCTLVVLALQGQSLPDNHLQQIEQNLKNLAQINPGLNEQVDFSVSGATIQEFLRGLAESNNLNISVDPNLNFRIYNNFTNEKVMNILLFLAKEYNLDIHFLGSIMSFSSYSAPPPPKPVIPVKEIRVKYNAYSNLLSLDLRSDTLSKVTRKITKESKKNIILSHGLSDKIVSVFIQDATFDDAIQKMAYANDLKVVKTDDGFYVITTPEEGENLLAKELPKSNYQNPFPPINERQKRPTKTRDSGHDVFVNVKADSLGRARLTIEAMDAPIGETIKAAAAAAGVSYFLFSELKGTSSLRILDVPFDDFLRKLLQGTDYTFKKSGNMYMIGDRNLEGLRTSRVIQLQYRSVNSILEVIPADIKKGVEVKSFVELNSILVTGSEPQIEEIEAFVNSLDKVVPMVLIDVIIMDVRKGKTVETGIEAGLDTAGNVKSGGAIFPGLNFTFSSKSVNQFLSWLGSNNTVNLGKVTPNFYVKLKALEQNSNVNIRSTPKLSTLNGHKATLSIGSTRYYSVTTQNVVGSLTPQTVVTKQYQQVQANLGITINPIVSGDDQVTLDIDVNNSDFLEIPTDQPPPSATSQFTSLIRVKNEEMIVLGGLERYQKSESGSGFPILSRIPVLKWLFSSRSKSNSKTITVVFIKPTIIY